MKPMYEFRGAGLLSWINSKRIFNAFVLQLNKLTRLDWELPVNNADTRVKVSKSRDLCMANQASENYFTPALQDLWSSWRLPHAP